MSWCDKVAAIPTVGITLDSHLLPAGAIIGAITPLLRDWVDGHELNFSIEESDPFAVTATLNDGIQFGFEHAKVFVSFTHRLRARAVSAGPPTIEMLSTPQPFTELLPRLADNLFKVAAMLPSPRERKIRRIGIISKSALVFDDLPPGVKKFIEYISKPWNGSTESFQMQIVSNLSETKEWTDRCIHNVTKTDQDKGLINLHFDWQRQFKTGPFLINRDDVASSFGRAEKAALEYFEDIAQGERFYEQVRE